MTDTLHTPTAEQLATATATLPDGATIGFRLATSSYTYRSIGGRLERLDGLHEPTTVIAMNDQAWHDYVEQLRTFINLYLAGELVVESGSFEHLADWDPTLRLLHAGIPLYDPRRRDLSEFDPAATVSLSDDDARLRARLEALGYLHVTDVFTADEMGAANAEVDRLAALATPNDDESWWVSTPTGSQVLCRLVYTTLRSIGLAQLEADPRVARLGSLLPGTRRIAPDRMEGTSVLLKAPGDTAGLSNIPWHQDCGMGGHGFMCPSVSIGIQLTGSSAETGNLQIVPGSHGQTMHYRWEHKVDHVPIVEIDTRPGDVTVHVQDVMHASPKPTGAGGRRTMYVTFYPPALWDHIGAGEAFNDLVRNRTEQVAELQ